jgi:hypothetical protein
MATCKGKIGSMRLPRHGEIWFVRYLLVRQPKGLRIAKTKLAQGIFFKAAFVAEASR